MSGDYRAMSEGLNKLAALIRKYQHHEKELAVESLNFIVKYIKGLVGSLFIAE
jgi:hypothetical protein